jgi:hypothetical protein
MLKPFFKKNLDGKRGKDRAACVAIYARTCDERGNTTTPAIINYMMGTRPQEEAERLVNLLNKAWDDFHAG